MEISYQIKKNGILSTVKHVGGYGLEDCVNLINKIEKLKGIEKTEGEYELLLKVFPDPSYITREHGCVSYNTGATLAC